MKKLILILFLPLVSSISFAQNKAAAEKLVNEGVDLHDKGDYEGALKKYNKALEVDNDNLSALAEKAYTVMSLKKYEEAISLSQKAIELYPDANDLKTVYVTYGNALDALHMTDKSIEIYDQGIKKFPDSYSLYYNKGVSLVSNKKVDESILCFEKAVLLNPKHASSHSGIARLSAYNNKKIPSILAFCRFLVIEPQGTRAEENLAALQKMMTTNVEETGKKSVTINISADLFSDTTADGKPGENSFATTDLILSLTAAMDYDKKNKKKSQVELFLGKMEVICASLAEGKNDNYGFYWEYYASYFIEMKENKFLETFAYIAFASTDDKDVASWLKSNKKETDKFFEWSQSYDWKSN